MTNKSIIVLSAIIFLLMLAACGEKIERPTPVLTQDQIEANRSEFEAPVVPSGSVAGGVKHYTCPNGHDGSDSQGNCITCGTALVHNQAFHDVQPAAPTPGAEPAQNTAGVWHYTCPNGHPGGSASATTCSQCGATLAHNQLYHDQPSSTTAAPDIINTPPPTDEPPQNSAGVWHYTCPNGHAGGSGSATPCAVCGTTLAHNQGYHN